jgi:hypothetical protein
MNNEVASTASGEEGRQGVTSVDVAAMPWVFTQQHPLDTADFIKEAKRRGFDLDLSILRELYRHNLVVPFVYVSDRQVGPIPEPPESEPRSGGTRLTDLRHARDRGRLTDLTTMPFRRKLRFERREEDSRRWWNGLIYSRYQSLMLPELRGVLAYRRQRLRDRRIITRLPAPHFITLDRAAKLRTIALMITALEARYLPSLDPEWLHLVNTDEKEWGQYRQAFDPMAMSRTLHYAAEQARKDAEWLLFLAHRLDPVGDSWSRLMRRAPRTSWKELQNDALLALDYREAAEILLRFYEDFVECGEAEPLPDIPRMSWHPLKERLSYRQDTLDQDLMQLGISPHPRVVLAIEGEAEEVHTPLVWRLLRYPEAPELVRILKLGGVDRDLEKVAALAVAPLVAGKFEPYDSWRLIKPPTRLLVAVDPEGKYFAPNKVNRTRRQILNKIKAVLRAQGVTTANPGDLDELVEIRTWSEACYEFAHFSDSELADGIMAVHETINGLNRDELIESIAATRGRRKDIKEVWSQWDYKVSKEKLAHALWPALEGHIQRCKVDADATIPPIVEVIQDAYHIAQRWRYASFVLRSEPSSADG